MKNVYETDHSYFLAKSPDSTTILDEDMAVNASDKKENHENH